MRVQLVLALLLVGVPMAARADVPVAAPAVPAEAAKAEGLAPQGWRVVGAAEGDLDGDGRADAAVVAEDPADPDRPRMVIVARRDEDGKLRADAVGPMAGLCRACGGALGDPFASITIDGGAVVLAHQGGSASRWGVTYRFERVDGRWRLVSTSRDSLQAPEGKGTETQHDLRTGLVIETEREVENAPGAVRRYVELRAVRVGTAPPLTGAFEPAAWPGPVVSLESDGAKTSARLRAAVHGELLYVAAEVQAESVSEARLLDAKGRAVTPVERAVKQEGPGFVSRGAFRLADFGAVLPPSGDVVVRATVEVARSSDGKAVLSTSHVGRRWPAAIRLGAEPELPLLESLSAP